MVFLYFTIALATERVTGIPDLIERIWYIIKNERESDGDAFELIKAFIEINVSKWNKYFMLWEEIVVGNKKKERLKSLMTRIPAGSISILQFVWIVGYVVYHIIRKSILPELITDEYVFLIDFVGLGFFILTSGNVIGLKSFMVNVFECFSGEKNVTQALSMLEAQIVVGARHYGFLKGRLGFIAEKYKIEREAVEQIQIAKADLQIVKLQESLDKLQKEMKKKNGGKKKK